VAITKEMEIKQKKIELALLTEETQIMTADSSIMDPMQRAWF
jgi:hypothetical protein